LRTVSILETLLVFAVALSLASLPGPLTGVVHLPTVALVRASPAPCPFSQGVPCSERWLPAGPSTNTEIASIFASDVAEQTALLAQQIDFSDVRLNPVQIACLSQTGTSCSQIPGVNPSAFYVTAPVATHDYYELQFLLSNSFWGINFHFGQDVGCVIPITGQPVNDTACPGVSIRQAFAHLVDKSSFVANAPTIAGLAVPVDNPVPPSDGLVTPNPCSWDSLFPRTSTSCVVGALAGTAYHLGSSASLGHDTTGTLALYPWEPAVDNGGKADLCAAAQHLVVAGVATGFESTTCVLSGISANASVNPVNILARSDRPARLALGDGLVQDVCYLFTGHWSDPACQIISTPTTQCTGPCYVTETRNISLPPFCINLPCISTPNCLTCWQVYTAGFGSVFPFDSTLYGLYNSVFVQNLGTLDVPPCSSASAPIDGASNYMFACVPHYDSFSNQMEFSPCVNASGDPIPGQVAPTFATCPGTTKLSAVSAAYQAEDLFGRLALTIPLYSPSAQFGYLSNWSGVINSNGNGVSQYFTWFNARSSTSSPATPGLPSTFTQGFAAPTKSLNPYASSTFSDFQTIGVIYDSIGVLNPLSSGQYFDYLASGHSTHCNTNMSAPCDLAHLGYTPPTGTVATIRFSLRADIFWQSDSVGTAHPATALTSWDVRFSYLTLKSTGSIQGGALWPVIDVHVLDRANFDVNLNAIGPFILPSITSPTVIPGRYWSSTCAGAIWDADVTAGAIPDSCMSVSAAMSSITFDPLSSPPTNGVSPGILIGSGPFECQSTGGIVGGGGGCSSTGFQNPPGGGSYTFTRFGCNRATGTCNAPGANPTSTYFRSAGNLALAIWAGINGDSTHDLVIVSSAAFCFNKPFGTPGCGQWQRGIGNPGTGTPVNVGQVSAVIRFSQDGNWVSPFNWLPGIPAACCPFASSAPLGIEGTTPVLYEGTVTLNPCSTDPINGYDC
jgi:hypothetical protein